MRRSRRILLIFAILSGWCWACTLAHGYFHQVTAIRGRVVGKDLGPFGFRWLRQSFGIHDASLTLFEYGGARFEELKKVAEVKTDDHGDFDFGPIPKGHYFLNVVVKDSDSLGGLFDVEITDSVRTTKSVMIDVSPIHPDCTGGHEFVETKS